MLIQMLDIIRIIGVCLTFFWGYQIGYAHGYDPVAQLHFMIPVIIIIIAGISGLEGLFFGERAAKAKGFKGDRNYQRQSAFGLLSYAVVAPIVALCGWGIRAELTIFFAFMFFFIFSGANHALDAIRNRNFKWQNINRPFITLTLIAGMLYPVIAAIKGLH